jgi:cytochrome c peroxidase
VATLAFPVLSMVALFFIVSCLGQSQVMVSVQGGSDQREAAVAPAVAASTPIASGSPIAVPANRSRIALGRAIFFDPALSEPPGTSCASCHTPERAFSGNHGSLTGVAQGSRPDHFARRSTPSVLYLRYVPRFHFFADDDAIQPSPFGGFFWDGRADSIVDVVKEPLLDPNEMNNRDLSQIAHKIASAPYVDEFRDEFGDILGDPQAAVTAVGRALEAFLTSDEMAPFSSKYDAYVRGKARLTTLEARGLKLFKDPDKGNCISCHRFYDTSTNPERSLFTDFGYDAVAAPRNREISANADPQHFDLGLCERRDERTPSNDEMWCVSFRTPSLRNVAVRQSFMHNGVFKSLREAVTFYATRATNPKRWYPSGVRFDDVPAKYRGQVNVNSIPYNRREGHDPALTNADIDAIVAFLGTLTDAAYRKDVRTRPKNKARSKRL